MFSRHKTSTKPKIIVTVLDSHVLKSKFFRGVKVVSWLLVMQYCSSVLNFFLITSTRIVRKVGIHLHAAHFVNVVIQLKFSVFEQLQRLLAINLFSKALM
jgi:hypothetical protein